MKKLNSLIKNQSGMSMATILGVIALGIGGVTYLITTAIPKLQDEKEKISAQLNYRVFISSLNDYIVHGIRERWCINYQDGESDLLLSSKCSSKAKMEEIVTYPGNLERILWTADTIGTQLTAIPTAENANKILSLNFLRYNSTPRKANRLLKYEDVAPTDGKLTFKISKKVLEDMNETHPLYIMSQGIKDCVKSINVEVFQVKDFINLASGDERKIGIKITSDINRTKISCLSVRAADAISYYTFYPRRLHTFSLIKYGDLSGSAYNEFHGPVYVAGNFILPPESKDKSQSSIFYNALTLGVYNGGAKNGKLIPGVVVKNANPFSHSEWGHPYKSKQDNYEGFRGFLGGVRLDSSEDKGLYNLFDHTNSTAADLSQLEACIEDNEAQLNKSKNSDSILAYRTYHQTLDESLIKLSFTKRNRFAITNKNPEVVTSGKSKENPLNADATYNKDSNVLSEININFSLKSKDGQNVSATLGDNSSLKINLDLENFNLDQNSLQKSNENLDKAERNNYKQAVTSKQLKKTTIYNEYEKATSDLIKLCDANYSSDCDQLGYKSPKCDPEKSADCSSSTASYASEAKKYQQSKQALKQYIDNLSDLQKSPNQTALEVSISPAEPFKGQPVLNQRLLKIQTPAGWREFYKIISDDVDRFTFEFDPHHNGFKNSLSLKLDLQNSTPKIITSTPSGYGNNNSQQKPLANNWSNSRTNNAESDPPTLVPLNCPQGMGTADWDLDMSPSTNFSWNYANTPPGAKVDNNDHQQADPIIFHPGNPPLEGHAYSLTKSVVTECIIPSDRSHVYGFYACNKLTIQSRNSPLYMIGTFIVKDLEIPDNLTTPIHWYSIWDTHATDLIMTNLNSYKSSCSGVKNLVSKTWKDVVASSTIAATVDSCGPLDMVTNGPNNFSWTTVDPDIGIANPGDSMTSQKVNRIQKWVIREESRKDHIR